MSKFKKKKTEEENFMDELFASDDAEDNEDKEAEEEEEEFNPNKIEVVVDRVEHGLVGTLKILDDTMNKPLIKQGDFIHLRAPSRLAKKDFVLYKSHEEYFLRRIIKFDEDDIYVAGDNEKAYHIIRKEDVIAKAIGRQRKKQFLSFTLNPTNKFYTFRKYNLAWLRLGKRVSDYDMDVSASSLENAMQKLENQPQQKATETAKPVYSLNGIDLDSELASFLNPDDLVRELRGAQPQEPLTAANLADEEKVIYEEEIVEEEVEAEPQEEELEIALSDDDI